jgi:GNAT superfamily N-acetyltransferase
LASNHPAPSIVIRPYADPDWDAICAIHDAARLDELRDSVGLQAFLTLADTFEAEDLFGNPVVVAELDGVVAGFMSASSTEITWLYTDPAHYRRGIARALVNSLLAVATEPIELEVLERNHSARAFYERMGFVWHATTTGKLAGNEKFQATGHTLVWTPPLS